MERKNGAALHKQRLVSKQLEEQRNRLNRAKDLLLSGGLDADDYRSMKTEAENKVAVLLNTLSAMADPQEAVNKLLNRYDKVLLNLAFLFQKAAVANKRKMIGLLFPENLIYTSDGFRDGPLTNMMKLLYSKE